jgi:hypothetical protein
MAQRVEAAPRAVVDLRRGALPNAAEPSPRVSAHTWTPTLQTVWHGLAAVAAALGAALLPMEPIDYWWSVRLGSMIRQFGALPADDPLVYTPVRSGLVDGQWLARVILSTLHDLGGVELSLSLRTVVAIGAALMLAHMSRQTGAGPRIAAVVSGLAVILFVPGLAVRPQLFAVLPFIVVLLAATRPPTSLRGVVGVAATVVFWANVHGSFILIYPLLGVGVLTAVADWLRARDGESSVRLRDAVRLALACGVAPLLNPHGLALAGYVSDTVLVNGGFGGGGTPIGVLGVEWGAPAIRTAYGGIFYGSIVLVIGLITAGCRPRLGEGLLLLGFGVLAVSSVRHVLWWSLVCAPFVARSLAELSARPGIRWLPRAGPLPTGSPVLNVVCLGLFGAMILASLPWYRERLPLPPSRTAILDRDTPVRLAEFLAAHPHEGRLFSDNRFEAHPADVWQEYSTISRGHVSWQRRLDSYGVTRLALNPDSQGGLLTAVREAPATWTQVYEDHQAVVFERASPGQAPVDERKGQVR